MRAPQINDIFQHTKFGLCFVESVAGQGDPCNTLDQIFTTTATGA